ncbi:ABC transporter substrate-binding protein [Diaminobutyricimonas sp. LJ205]|uniref:ABC transporter substrate-binding protein n=1 Tax=Diaminobutyricimonas sp. LJ205 TaxID=2683590 RepID=UPI0012F4EDD8|nr:ABC transporter substrate-binding protein [Diaminobutyricimonas sp. LJ205]
MASISTRRRRLGVIGGTAAAALLLAGCATSDGGGSDLDGIIVGTTDVLTSLDPAGSWDNGSFAVQINVFPMLMNTAYGSPEVEPDIAESAEFTAPNQYTVTLKEGLTFANGNDLTSSDVKFSFDRIINIADENGPSPLLGNIESIEAPDDVTVVFTLKVENDQTFSQVLASPAGSIVDEQVFSADELTPSEEIVDGNAFAGPYVITDYSENELIQYEAFEDYQGLYGTPETPSITGQYFTEETSLKLAVQEGDVDVAYRSLSPTDLADLREQDEVTVYDGPGSEIRYMVFNFATQPFGTATPEADPAKALAVRQAVASVVDREAIANEVYNSTFVPLYSYVPDGMLGANESLKGIYGDGNGGPDLEKAAQVLEAAGIPTPVPFNLQYNPDHYGNSSDEEYALIQSQLNDSGLFEVELQSTLWDVYNVEYREGLYPVFQLGWFPDYPDPDNYLSPFFLPTPDADGNLIYSGFFANGYNDPAAIELIRQQAVTVDEAERVALVEQAQDQVASQLSTLPLLQGASVAVAGTGITGVEETLDTSAKFRYASLGRE